MKLLFKILAVFSPVHSIGSANKFAPPPFFNIFSRGSKKNGLLLGRLVAEYPHAGPCCRLWIFFEIYFLSFFPCGRWGQPEPTRLTQQLCNRKQNERKKTPPPKKNGAIAVNTIDVVLLRWEGWWEMKTKKKLEWNDEAALLNPELLMFKVHSDIVQSSISPVQSSVQS